MTDHLVRLSLELFAMVERQAVWNDYHLGAGASLWGSGVGNGCFCSLQKGKSEEIG